EVIDFLRDKVAKWWLPDEVRFIDEVPKTSVGKFDKKLLRANAVPIKEGATEPARKCAPAPASESTGSVATGSTTSGTTRFLRRRRSIPATSSISKPRR